MYRRHGDRVFARGDSVIASPRRAKKLERRKNLYWTGRSSLPERTVGAAGSKAASSTSSISQSQRAGSRNQSSWAEPWACDHAAS